MRGTTGKRAFLLLGAASLSVVIGLGVALSAPAATPQGRVDAAYAAMGGDRIAALKTISLKAHLAQYDPGESYSVHDPDKPGVNSSELIQYRDLARGLTRNVWWDRPKNDDGLRRNYYEVVTPTAGWNVGNDASNGRTPKRAIMVGGVPAHTFSGKRLTVTLRELERLNIVPEMKAHPDRVSAIADQTVNGKTYPVGTMYISAKATTLPILQKVAADKGLTFDAVASAPQGNPMMRLKPVRIGLWDQYGGSMPSGWTRWLFEQYEFPFEVVFPSTLDAGNLNAKYDVLIFVDGAIPVRDGGGGGFGAQPAAETIPAEFRGWLGRVTVAKTVPELKKFAENGGTILTIGSSTALGNHLGLPVMNALVERAADGTTRDLPREKYYIPGSILEARIDNTNPLAYGMGEHAMVFYDESPAFRLRPDAMLKGVKPVAWYDSQTPLRSGWAWGQQYLSEAVSIVDAPVGKGHVVLFGNEVNWRGQPHGTFKLLFNGIYYGSASTPAPGTRTTEQP